MFGMTAGWLEKISHQETMAGKRSTPHRKKKVTVNIYDALALYNQRPKRTNSRISGLYRAGPASLAAIKRGDVSIGYDTGFLFAEVNADKCYWLVNEKQEAKLNEIKQNE